MPVGPSSNLYVRWRELFPCMYVCMTLSEHGRSKAAARPKGTVQARGFIDECRLLPRPGVSSTKVDYSPDSSAFKLPALPPFLLASIFTPSVLPAPAGGFCLGGTPNPRDLVRRVVEGDLYPAPLAALLCPKTGQADPGSLPACPGPSRKNKGKQGNNKMHQATSQNITKSHDKLTNNQEQNETPKGIMNISSIQTMLETVHERMYFARTQIVYSCH